MALYVYRQDDVVVRAGGEEGRFANEDERNEFFAKLVLVFGASDHVNVRRHVPVCDVCGQPVYYLDKRSGEQVRITASEFKVPRSDGKSFVIDSALLHYVDVHSHKPEEAVVNAVEKFAAQAF